MDAEAVESLANTIREIFSSAWDRHSKVVHITNRSKPWWSPVCASALATYRTSGDPKDWTTFRRTTREARRAYFALEMQEALSTCSNRSSPGPDHITWSHLKFMLSSPSPPPVFLALANACISTGHWPSHFKESISVIIPKPGKPDYSTPKSFRPIALLNTLGKLFEKMLSTRLQFDAVNHTTCTWQRIVVPVVQTNSAPLMSLALAGKLPKSPHPNLEVQ